MPKCLCRCGCGAEIALFGGLVPRALSVRQLSRVWDAAPFSTVQRTRAGRVVIHVLRDEMADPDMVAGNTFEEAVQGAARLLGVE